jgi:hypothetical protein
MKCIFVRVYDFILYMCILCLQASYDPQMYENPDERQTMPSFRDRDAGHSMVSGGSSTGTYVIPMDHPDQHRRREVTKAPSSPTSPGSPPVKALTPKQFKGKDKLQRYTDMPKPPTKAHDRDEDSEVKGEMESTYIDMTGGSTTNSPNTTQDLNQIHADDEGIMEPMYTPPDLGIAPAPPKPCGVTKHPYVNVDEDDDPPSSSDPYQNVQSDSHYNNVASFDDINPKNMATPDVVRKTLEREGRMEAEVAVFPASNSHSHGAAASVYAQGAGNTDGGKTKKSKEGRDKKKAAPKTKPKPAGRKEATQKSSSEHGRESPSVGRHQAVAGHSTSLPNSAIHGAGRQGEDDGDLSSSEEESRDYENALPKKRKISNSLKMFKDTGRYQNVPPKKEEKKKAAKTTSASKSQPRGGGEEESSRQPLGMEPSTSSETSVSNGRAGAGPEPGAGNKSPVKKPPATAPKKTAGGGGKKSAITSNSDAFPESVELAKKLEARRKKSEDQS